MNDVDPQTMERSPGAAAPPSSTAHAGGRPVTAVTLPPHARKLLDDPNLVVLTTLYPDGSPHSTPVWALREGDEVLMSTITRRVKARNLARDPRAAVVVIDPENPVCYFSICGTVSLTEEDDGRVLDALSMKYLGIPYPEEDPANVRVTLRLRPTRVIAQYEPAR